MEAAFKRKLWLRDCIRGNETRSADPAPSMLRKLVPSRRHRNGRLANRGGESVSGRLQQPGAPGLKGGSVRVPTDRVGPFVVAVRSGFEFGPASAMHLLRTCFVLFSDDEASFLCSDRVRVRTYMRMTRSVRPDRSSWRTGRVCDVQQPACMTCTACSPRAQLLTGRD
jgi:hypothetical protein